jgi:hypothetical protein
MAAVEVASYYAEREDNVKAFSWLRVAEERGASHEAVRQALDLLISALSIRDVLNGELEARRNLATYTPPKEDPIVTRFAWLQGCGMVGDQFSFSVVNSTSADLPSIAVRVVFYGEDNKPLDFLDVRVPPVPKGLSRSIQARVEHNIKKLAGCNTVDAIMNGVSKRREELLNSGKVKDRELVL